MRWQDCSLEEEERTDTPRDCCGSSTTEFTGNVLHLNSFHSWYTALWSDAHPDIPMHITIYTGDWGEDAPQSHRWATRIAVHQGDEGGCSLMDWSAEEQKEISMFTPLNRDDVLNSDYAPQLWACVDAVLMNECRLEHIRQ